MNSEIIADKVLRRSTDKTKEPVKFFISKETTVTLGKDSSCSQGCTLTSSSISFFPALACEFFVREVAIRSWAHTSTNARKTLQKVDVYAAVNDIDMFDCKYAIMASRFTPAETQHDMSYYSSLALFPVLIDKIPRMSVPAPTNSSTNATSAPESMVATPAYYGLQHVTQQEPSDEQDGNEEKVGTITEGHGTQGI